MLKGVEGPIEIVKEQKFQEVYCLADDRIVEGGCGD